MDAPRLPLRHRPSQASGLQRVRADLEQAREELLHLRLLGKLHGQVEAVIVFVELVPDELEFSLDSTVRCSLLARRHEPHAAQELALSHAE